MNDKPFRIAIRAEGNFINAYLAAPDSMASAQLIGCVARGACDADRTIFTEFQTLMQRAVAIACKGALGVEPLKFETQPAPEHERGGHA